jgi:hypothetical protein
MQICGNGDQNGTKRRQCSWSVEKESRQEKLGSLDHSLGYACLPQRKDVSDTLNFIVNKRALSRSLHKSRIVLFSTSRRFKISE